MKNFKISFFVSFLIAFTILAGTITNKVFATVESNPDGIPTLYAADTDKTDYPGLKLDSIKAGDVLKSYRSEYTLSGTVNDIHTKLRISFNGEVRDYTNVNEDGTFTAEVPLPKRKNTIVVSAESANGKKESVEFTVNYEYKSVENEISDQEIFYGAIGTLLILVATNIASISLTYLTMKKRK